MKLPLHQKHFVGLSDNVTYVVEQLNVKSASKYKYTLNYNPRTGIEIEDRNSIIDGFGVELLILSNILEGKNE